MYLFFDTETTGLYDFKASPKEAHQPRIVQLAAKLLDEKLVERAAFKTLIDPADQDWTIKPEAQNVHGISKVDCVRYGIPIKRALIVLWEMAEAANVYCCHNAAYDSNLISVECDRLNGRKSFLEGKKCFCTMAKLTPVLKLPGKHGYKWPTLQEAHKWATGEEFENGHDAMIDVDALIRVFKGIKEKEPKLLEGL